MINQMIKKESMNMESEKAEEKNLALEELKGFKNKSIGYITAKDLGEMLLALGNRDVVFETATYRKNYSWEDNSEFSIADKELVDLNSITIKANSVHIGVVNIQPLKKAVKEFKKKKAESE